MLPSSYISSLLVFALDYAAVEVQEISSSHGKPSNYCNVQFKYTYQSIINIDAFDKLEHCDSLLLCHDHGALD